MSGASAQIIALAPVRERQTADSRAVEPASPGDFLIYLKAQGHLDQPAIARAESAIHGTGQSIDTVLLELGLLSERDLARLQAACVGLNLAAPEDFPAEPVAADAVPAAFWASAGLIPLAFDTTGIVVATWRPFEQEQIRALAFYLGCKVTVRIAVKSLFEREYSRLYAAATGDSPVAITTGSEGGEDDVERLRDVAREEPVIRLVNRLIAEAANRRASDIHIEALEDHVRVRYRIDGALQTVERLEKGLQAGVVSRIKILARLNIAERRLPQDGRFKLPVRGTEIDFRISTVPALHGESVVLRILDRRELALNFPALGFDADSVAQIERLIENPNGIVLVTGPTGSGKTTTLYAAMTALNSAERKILTIEDPIEYHLPGINQTQVKPQIGLDFASALRAFLRQDPDIIMVGEIRDGETARTAVQASLTGHLVLSTVHTNSAATTITRLIDMGIEDYLLVSTLRGVIAQRLVRRLCPHCAQPAPAGAALRDRLMISEEIRHSLASAELKNPFGCRECGGSGYRGRTTICEILPITAVVQEAVLKGGSVREIEEVARHLGMRSLFACGLALAAAGTTSLEEVLRAAGPQ